MNTFKRWILRLSILALLLLLLLGGSMVYLYYHQEKLIQPIVSQINNQLEVEVGVGNIHLSFREFPMVSVAFSNVFIPEALPGSKDTLISVETAYLSFRPWDLWKDDIKVSAVSLNNGKVYLRSLPQGKNNWSFWKTSDDTSTVNIGLRELVARDLLFRYQSQDALLEDHVDYIRLKGDFNDSKLAVQGKGDVSHRKLRIADFTYDRPVAVKADFNLEKDGDGVRVSSKRFSLDGEPVTLMVYLNDMETDVHITGNQLSASAVSNLLPDAYRDALSWLAVDGVLDMEFSAHIPDIGPSERFLVFALKEGHLKIRDRNLEIHNVQTNGELHFATDVRSRNGALDVEEFRGEIDKGGFNLSMSLEDFNRPLLQVNADAQLSLDKLFVLAGIDTLRDVKGDASFNLKFQNRFNSLIAPTVRDFISAQSSGSLRIENGAFRFDHSDLLYHNFMAVCSLEKNDLHFDTFSLAAGKSDVALVGRLKNILPFLLVPNESVQLEADAHSRYLLLDELLAAQGEFTEPYKLTFPDYLTAKLNARIDEFHFNAFAAKDARGTCVLSSEGFQAALTNVSTLNGSISRANLFIDGKSVPYKLQLQASGEKIDMNAMFNAFNNFGQDVITARELHGTLTADLQLKALLTPELNIPEKSITADAKVQLDNGRLVHFEPMEALSRFARIDELRDVRFDRLSNTLRIDGGVIYIPAMDISSNVMDLELEGSHTFENVIDYTVRMDLREALFAERKRKKSEFDDIMVISSESGARLWVTMKGPASDPRISIDNRQIRRTLGEQFREQGKQLRGKDAPKPKQEYEFEFDW